LTGGFVGPYAIGLIKDATGGPGGAFVGLAVSAFVAAALCLLLRRQTLRARSRTPALATSGAQA
jgi:multisubunit Na+/H+ antiporter MnhB subunit